MHRITRSVLCALLNLAASAAAPPHSPESFVMRLWRQDNGDFASRFDEKTGLWSTPRRVRSEGDLDFFTCACGECYAEKYGRPNPAIMPASEAGMLRLGRQEIQAIEKVEIDGTKVNVAKTGSAKMDDVEMNDAKRNAPEPDTAEKQQRKRPGNTARSGDSEPSTLFTPTILVAMLVALLLN